MDLHRTLRFSSNPVIKESGVSGVFFESIPLRFIRDSKTKEMKGLLLRYFKAQSILESEFENKNYQISKALKSQITPWELPWDPLNRTQNYTMQCSQSGSAHFHCDSHPSWDWSRV